jgi:O-antigen/teichoic acid export membrane protein
MRASVAASMAGKAAEMVTLLLLATLVPRVLGPGDYGRFSVPLTIVTLGSLALTLGGPTVLARFVPAAPPEQRLAVARSLGRRLAKGRALQLGAIAAAVALAAVLAPDALPAVDTALVLAALALNVAATLGLQVGLGLGRTGAWSARYPLQNTVLIIAVLALQDSAGGTGGPVAILIAAVAGAAFAAAVIIPIVRPPVERVPVPEGAIRFGALQATGAALVQLTHRGGVLAAALLAGSAAETGFTALATGIALGVTYAVLQAFTVSLPHLADGPGDVSEAALRRLAGGILAVLVPGTLVVAAVLDRLVPTVFGAGYDGAVDAFGPALALVVLAPLNALAVQAAALRLRPDVAAAAGAASAATFVVVALLAVPAWGAAGATAAALAGTVAAAVVAGWRLPGAFGSRLPVATGAGAAAVLLVAGVA